MLSERQVRRDSVCMCSADTINGRHDRLAMRSSPASWKNMDLKLRQRPILWQRYKRPLLPYFFLALLLSFLHHYFSQCYHYQKSTNPNNNSDKDLHPLHSVWKVWCANMHPSQICSNWSYQVKSKKIADVRRKPSWNEKNSTMLSFPTKRNLIDPNHLLCHLHHRLVFHRPLLPVPLLHPWPFNPTFRLGPILIIIINHARPSIGALQSSCRRWSQIYPNHPFIQPLWNGKEDYACSYTPPPWWTHPHFYLFLF